METLKKGSTGAAVKTLQQKLGITADGIFGTATEAAVRKFQTEHQLTADGIVGAKTWAALGIQSTGTSTRCVDPSVLYMPLSVHVSRLANRDIKYIAIHYTAGGSSAAGSAQHIKSIFERRQASADFAVDDRDICQFNPDLNNYYCWSVGDRKNPYSSGGSLNGKACNRNSISIEICSNLKAGTSSSAANHEGWYFTEASLNNALKLVRILMNKFDIPIDRVIRHYDVTGKLCPGVVGWNNEHIYTTTGTRTSTKNNSDQWLKFKSEI